MNKALQIVSFFLCLNMAWAQVPKKVILEHFTNTSCGPCATQNPGFESNILSPNNFFVRHISYHPWWPSNQDPFYLYNVGSNTVRTQYYGVTGVPDVAVNGNRAQGQPASISQGLMDQIAAETSPLAVEATMIDKGLTRDLVIKVKTVGQKPAGDFVLHTVLIEKEVNFTTPAANGETHFPNVMRKMFPDENGTPINLAEQGSEATETFTYTEDSDLQLDKLEVIAFIQNTATKEILNVGSTFDGKTEVIKTPTAKVQNLASNQSHIFTYEMVNNNAVADELSLNLVSDAPSDFGVEIFVAGVSFGKTAKVAVNAGEKVLVEVKVVSGATSAIVTNKLAVQSKLNENLGLNPANYSSYVISNVEDFIINNSVAAATGVFPSSWSKLITDPFVANNSKKHANGNESIFLEAAATNQLAGVKHIYFNAGWTFPALTPKLATVLQDLASKGVNILISGQDVAWASFDPATQADPYRSVEAINFSKNIMGVDYIDDGASTLTGLVPVKTDLLYGSIAQSTIKAFYTSTYFFPDRIKPSPAGKTIFTYNGSTNVALNSAAIRNNSGVNRTVWLAPGIEQLNATTAALFMDVTYKWFHGIISSTEFDNALQDITIGQNQPNPSAISTVIPVTGIANDNMNLEIVDMIGQKVYTTPLQIGQQNVEVNTSLFGSGVYFYSITDGKNATRSKSMIVSNK